MLVDAYHEEVVGERERTVLRLHPKIASVKAAILPLIGKSEEHGRERAELYEELRQRHRVEYDDSGQIGRRYRRQDEIGTPWCKSRRLRVPQPSLIAQLCSRDR